MFHHRSCGTTALVALMAAHRAARGPEEGLRQQDITRMTETLLATPGPLALERKKQRDLRHLSGGLLVSGAPG